ncbi:MAG: carboxymuconolactone decarboxylase family protein [Planctomycetota bacterium]|nr:carboxymuconolactone decarboxylase family protein [Planctomycetota bacterium]
MDHVKNLASSIPDAAKDIRLNLQNVLGDGSLSEEQRLGIALACAYVSRNPRLLEALLQDAAKLAPAWTEDAKAAAALMAMNNVFYRFRHMIGKPAYSSMPARLRMQRLSQPQTSKLDFELMCIAVSAIHGCEMCVRSHEHSLMELGASEAQVFDAVRIGAVVYSGAIGLELEPQGSATESP